MRLDLVVGPNGAGKTTFVEHVLLPELPPGTAFVNADLIAKARFGTDDPKHSYLAATIAAQTRSALIAQRLPFVAETVFSHPSKLELIEQAQDAGYQVFLHVLLIPLALSAPRVAARVAAGGHDVPANKLVERYPRIWPLVVQAIRASDAAQVYDNASQTGPTRIADFMLGEFVGVPHWPAWTPAALRAIE